jgi:hypothetical protein
MRPKEQQCSRFGNCGEASGAGASSTPCNYRPRQDSHQHAPKQQQNAYRPQIHRLNGENNRLRAHCPRFPLSESISPDAVPPMSVEENLELPGVQDRLKQSIRAKIGVLVLAVGSFRRSGVWSGPRNLIRSRLRHR